MLRDQKTKKINTSHIFYILIQVKQYYILKSMYINGSKKDRVETMS